MSVAQAVNISLSELALLVQTLVNKQEVDKDKFWMMFEQQRAMIEQQKAKSLANINVLADNIKACIQDSKARSEQARKDNELRMIRQEAKENTCDALLKRYGDMLKISCLVSLMMTSICRYGQQVLKLFLNYSMPLDLRATLLLPYLNTKAKTLVCRLTPEQIKTYDSLKLALLREFRLTPKQYRTQFLEAKKKDAESYVQYNTRITTIFQYYIESRNVQDMKTLVE